MCKHLWVDNGWYSDYLSKMEKVGLKLDPETDVVSCRLLDKAAMKVMLDHIDRDESYIPF